MGDYVLRALGPGDSGRMEALLAREGLRRDARLDYSAGLFDGSELVGTGSCAGNTLRCLAVDPAYRGEGLLSRLVEHLIRVQYGRGCFHLFLYTKGASARYFQDLGFTEIARDGARTVFMENRAEGFSAYLAKLREEAAAVGHAPAGALVMNANPFTLGHRYLTEWAAERCGLLHLFVVSEDASVFPAADRMALVRAGTAHLDNVACHPTDSYLVSRATFPSYFLADGEAAVDSQARLDAAVFLRIAGALGVTARFLGTEPASPVTAQYNRVLAEVLPPSGIACEIVPRLERGGAPVSASSVRRALALGDWPAVEALVPESTLDYLHSEKGRQAAARLRGAGHED